MYVDPFWFGVFITLAIEAIALITYAIIFNMRKKR